ncbi:MAG: 3-deoxy-7-phosphoheptulonate synthase, partial [Polyangiaceae bacterium]
KIVIISLSPGADAELVRAELARLGLWATLGRSADGAASYFSIAPFSAACDPRVVEKIRGVASVSASASVHPKLDAQGPVVEVNGVRIGGAAPVLMAGPCSVESEKQITTIAEAVAAAGGVFLRGGAFKPRTSPYAFEGHGVPALGWLRKAADKFSLRVVTEVMGENDVAVVAEHADLLQVGSRNMQNYSLLRAIGRAKRPVLLKRAMSATIEEWLLSAEHLLAHGCTGVVLCERGIKSFDPWTRNLLDLGAVALVANVYKIPVIVDPSHATGRRDLVVPLAHAAIAAGASGLCIEAHDDPGLALSDGPQALALPALAPLARTMTSVWNVMHGGA